MQDCHNLTARQRQVYELVGRGLRNKEIAALLHLAEGTVKTYVYQTSLRLDMDRYQMIRQFTNDRAPKPAPAPEEAHF